MGKHPITLTLEDETTLELEDIKHIIKMGIIRKLSSPPKYTYTVLVKESRSPYKNGKAYKLTKESYQETARARGVRY